MPTQHPGMIKLTLTKHLDPDTDVFQLAKDGRSICGSSFLPALSQMHRQLWGKFDEIILTQASAKEIVRSPTLDKTGKDTLRRMLHQMTTPK